MKSRSFRSLAQHSLLEQDIVLLGVESRPKGAGWGSLSAEKLGLPCFACRLLPRRSRTGRVRLAHIPRAPARADEDATQRLVGSKPFRASGEGRRGKWRKPKEFEQDTRDKNMILKGESGKSMSARASRDEQGKRQHPNTCLLYTSPSPRDRTRSRMPSSA